jgi:TrmH family RNA methyltransferase
MGAESTGLSEFWLNKADRSIKIPMNGRADSLNVSVSTAIITFEAMRQRRVKS